MKTCKNCPDVEGKRKKVYKGNEPSPKGLGICGGCVTKAGVIAVGQDGNQWVSAQRGNGSMFWKKLAKSAKPVVVKSKVKSVLIVPNKSKSKPKSVVVEKSYVVVCDGGKCKRVRKSKLEKVKPKRKKRVKKVKVIKVEKPKRKPRKKKVVKVVKVEKPKPKRKPRKKKVAKPKRKYRKKKVVVKRKRCPKGKVRNPKTGRCRKK